MRYRPRDARHIMYQHNTYALWLIRLLIQVVGWVCAALERDGDTKAQRVPTCSNTAVSRYLKSHYKLSQTRTYAEVQVRRLLPATASAAEATEATPTCVELATCERVCVCVTSTCRCNAASCFFFFLFNCLSNTTSGGSAAARCENFFSLFFFFSLSLSHIMEWRSARWPCLATENKCVMFSLCRCLIPNTLASSLPSPPVQSGLSSLLFFPPSSVLPPLLSPSHRQATEFDPSESPYHFTSLTAHDARALWPATLNHGLLW